MPYIGLALIAAQPYATIEEMHDVLVRSNQTQPARPPRESFDNTGYELIDGEEHCYIASSGDDHEGQRTVREESSGHGAYEVIDERHHCCWW